MIAKKLLTTIAFAFVLLFSGCAKDDFVGADGLCPLVVSTVPENGAIDVPLNQIITATFNEKMNPATITGASFTVSINGVLIKGAVSYNGLTATFRPELALLPNTQYTGTITTMAKDERGNALQENYVWKFTTLPEYLVVATSNPLIGGITTGGGVFLKGTAVTVNAAPNAGYTFTNWTAGGVQVSTSPNYTFVLMGDRTLVANYTLIPPTQFAVNTSSMPIAGGSTTGSGSFDQGTLVTVTAAANTGYNFVNWTNKDTGLPVSVTPTYSFVLNANTNLQANFVLKTYTLTVIAVNGTVLKVPQQVTYNHGTSVVLTATPNTGYDFTSWSGDATGTNNPLTVVMNSNKIITANFTIKTYTLTVNAVNGSVLKVPNQTTYNHGASVVLTATPALGYVFTSWSGDATGNSNPLTVVMNSNKNITANFTAIVPTQFSVELSSNPNDGGRTDGAGLFNAGTTVQVTATPNSGFTFNNWTENNVIVPLAGANYQFIITKNRILVANFTAIPATGGLCPNPAVDLGLAGNYAILAESAITTTGVTSVTGDMGISPLAASFITGFGLSMDPSGTYSTSTLVTGKVYAADYTAPTPSNLTTTVDNMHTAFTTANGLAPNYTEYLAGNLNNVILPAGVYKYGTGLLLTNTITLDGKGQDCAAFVFQIAGSLTVSPNTKIVLINGAKADNIFWVVAGAGATLNTDVDFSGTILSKTLISLAQRSTVKGRLLAQSAVSLIGNTVVKPSN